MYGFGSMNIEHQPNLETEQGWGEPILYHPSCSCGWKGIVIDSMPVEYTSTFIKEHPLLKPLIEKYGLQKVLRTPQSSHGNEDDAIIQILKHIDYDPKSDRNYFHQKVNNKVKEYTSNIDSEDFSQALFNANEIKDLTEEMINMKHRVYLSENYTSNIEEFDEKLYSVYRKVLNELYNIRKSS